METFTIQLGLRGKIEIDESVMEGNLNNEQLKKELFKKLIISESFMDVIHDASGEYVVRDLDLSDEITKVIKGEAE